MSTFIAEFPILILIHQILMRNDAQSEIRKSGRRRTWSLSLVIYSRNAHIGFRSTCEMYPSHFTSQRCHFKGIVIFGQIMRRWWVHYIKRMIDVRTTYTLIVYVRTHLSVETRLWSEFPRPCFCVVHFCFHGWWPTSILSPSTLSSSQESLPHPNHCVVIIIYPRLLSLTPNCFWVDIFSEKILHQPGPFRTFFSFSYSTQLPD